MTISKSLLLEVTNRLRAVPPTNATLPCLGCVRITRNESGTSFHATDLEVNLSVEIPDPPSPNELARKLRALRLARESCDILVPSSTLDRCAKSADKGTDLTITPSKAGGAQITYQQGGITASVPAQAPNSVEFPEWPGKPKGDLPPTDPVPFSRQLAAIRRAEPAISQDATRYVLNGILWNTAGHIVATDGRRLHLEDVPPAPHDVIIPEKALRFIEPEMRASIRCKLEAKNRTAPYAIMFCAEIGGLTVRLHTKLVEGNYPNYMQVVPAEPFPLAVRLDNQATSKALAALAKNTRPRRTDSVALRFDPAASTVTFRMCDEAGGSSQFTVPALFTGKHTPPKPPIEEKEVKGKKVLVPVKRAKDAPPLSDASYNPFYLIDAFRCLDTLHFRDADVPAAPRLERRRFAFEGP